MSDDLPIFEDERRCGGPVLLLDPTEPLPLDRDDPFRDDNVRRALEKDVIQCLDDAGVLWKSVFLRRLRYIYDDGDDAAHRVFQVTAAMPEPDHSNDQWSTALKSILELFRARSYTDLNVEISADTSFPFGAHKESQLFPLLPSDPPEIDWSDLRPKLLSHLEEAPWRSIDVVRYGESDLIDENPVTILVTLGEKTPAGDYRRVKQELGRFLDQERPGKIQAVLCLGRPQLYIKLDADHYSLKAGIGVSIGLKGDERRSGTLGGYVTLQHPSTEEQRIFGLTCWHVVRPCEHTEELERKTIAYLVPMYPLMFLIDIGLDIHGMKPDDTIKLPEIIQPSLADHYDTMESLRKDIRQYQTTMSSAPPQTAEAYRTIYQKLIESAEEELQVREKHFKEHATFGRVWAASGFRVTSENMELDWALLNVAADRVGTNKVCYNNITIQGLVNIRHITNTDQIPKPDDFVESSWDSWLPIIKSIPGIGLVERCEGVFKKGRTTGKTAGCFEGHIESVLREVEGLPKGRRPGDARLILGTTRKLFSDVGDSGAFCLDPKGNWVGLIFGGVPGFWQSYATNAEDVVKDIEYITGWKFVNFQV